MADVTTLQEVYALPDIATDNIWYLDFIKMPSTGVSCTARDLHIRCQSFSMPSTEVQNLSVKIHNHTRHQPTITKQPETITIPFIETSDMRSTKFLKAWREICSRSNDNYVSLQSAREATIQFYQMNAQQQIVYTYRIEHVEFRNYGQLQYGNGSSVNAIIRQAVFQVGACYEMG